jgi:xylulokinase
MLLEKLRRRCDLSKIKSIGGCAQVSCGRSCQKNTTPGLIFYFQHATVWWTPESATFLSNLSPNSTLSSQLPSSATFSLQYTPVFQDTSTLAQSLSLEPLNIPSPSGTAAQAMKIREGNPDAWAQTGRVMLASAFLSSTLLGRWAPMSLSEVVGTGLWNEAREDWDDRVLEVVGGSPEEGARLRTMLGTVEQTPSTKIGTISPFLVERFGFDRDAFLVPFTSDHLSTYLSICPSPTDAILSFGSTDVLLTPAPHYIPGKLYSLFPHPAQDPSEKRKYVAMLMNR